MSTAARGSPTSQIVICRFVVCADEEFLEELASLLTESSGAYTVHVLEIRYQYGSGTSMDTDAMNWQPFRINRFFSRNSDRTSALRYFCAASPTFIPSAPL
eukprot:COSAG02_NODE_756_length_17532_cov_5.673550_7_plen_101_part_00